MDISKPVLSVVAGVLGVVFAAGVASTQASEAALNASFKAQSDIDKSTIQSQARISQLANETTELLGEYRVTMQQLDRLRIYNNHLQRLVDDQDAEKADYDRQLREFGDVELEIVPLMMEMIDTLERFIALDMPFLLDERTDRIERLRDLMDESGVDHSERYRQIMQAYQIETEYGRSMEQWSGELEIDGVANQGDFLRIGRVLLAFQTPDRTKTQVWNKNAGQWESADEFSGEITKGLRMAMKQAAPDMLRLPVSSAGAGS